MAISFLDKTGLTYFWGKIKAALDKKVDVDSIDLEGKTTTILAQVQALAAANKDYGRFSTNTDGGSSGISDKPTGTTNCGFCCTAYRVRDYGSEDTYYLTCYCKGDINPYTAMVAQNHTSISWSRMKPTVNNGTLTIQKNGTNVQTFTANQSSNATANITVPTKTSDLTSDVGGNTFIGTCSTEAATAAKVVTVSNDQNFVLAKGVMVSFKAPNTNTAENPTIEVNNTGPKSIWYNTAVVTTGNLNRAGQNGRYATYVYDGTYWVWVSWSCDDNTTYSTMSVSEGTTGTATNARTMRADYLKQIIDAHIRTADNLTPTADTPAGWNAALGANGHYYTWYSATGKFTNQPTGYGFLESFTQGTDIYQRWHSQASGPILYRSGNYAGWSNPSDGTWNTVASTASSITGNAATATKLQNSRTIALGTGATGTATSFDGSANITIPVTNVKDSYVTWGDKGIYNNITPDDAGCIDEFGHNKLAYLNPACLQVDYSTDGGTTWTSYGLNDSQKKKMCTYDDVWVKSGGSTAATSDNVTNLKLRIRLATAASTATGASNIYTQWKKILLDVTDPGSDATMTFKYRTIANYKAGTETWVDCGTVHGVRGGSGWNSIPIPSNWPDRFGGNYANQTSQPGQIELVFSNTKLGTWGDKKVSVGAIRLIGTTNWNTPSEMARTGRLYTIDESQNATFPSQIALTDIHALNILPKSGDTTYRHLGRSGEEWKDVWLTDAIYANGNRLDLPASAGTIALTSDIPSTDQVITITKTLTGNTSWTNTGIAGPDLETGTYIVQVLVGAEGGSFASLWSERWSGIMSWYASNTNNTSADEIILHNSGHADNDNDFFLRTKHDGETRNSTKYLSLQYAFKNSNSNSTTVTFKFRKMI